MGYVIFFHRVHTPLCSPRLAYSSHLLTVYTDTTNRYAIVHG